MATTIVCKNLITCLDSHLNTTSAETALTLKLTTSDLSKNHDLNQNAEFSNCWGFNSLQTTLPKDDVPASCYSHPWVTKPRLTLNSLALCTEHLGSESGSDIISATDDAAAIFHSSPPNCSTTSFMVHHQKTSNNLPRREMKSPLKPATFPPPLTTMIAPNSLRMRRCREGDRLIIEAVEAPFANSYLEAERSDGRLRLRCFSSHIGNDDGDEEEDEEIEEVCGGETTMEAKEVEIEDRGIGIGIESPHEHEESKIEGEVNNVEKFQQRLSRRCKEGSHGSKELMDNWKPAAVWVSTA